MEGSVLVARIKRAAECLVAIRSQLTFYEENIRQKRQPSFIGLPVFSPLLLICTEIGGTVRLCGNQGNKSTRRAVCSEQETSETQNDAGTRHDVVLGARTQPHVQVWIARQEITYFSTKANETKQPVIQPPAVIEDAAV